MTPFLDCDTVWTRIDRPGGDSNKSVQGQSQAQVQVGCWPWGCVDG